MNNWNKLPSSQNPVQKGFLNTWIEVSLVSAGAIEVTKYCLKVDLWKKCFWWRQTSLVLLGVSARYPQDSTHRTVRTTWFILLPLFAVRFLEVRTEVYADSPSSTQPMCLGSAWGQSEWQGISSTEVRAGTLTPLHL